MSVMLLTVTEATESRWENTWKLEIINHFDKEGNMCPWNNEGYLQQNTFHFEIQC